ncbi:uncharacterized protein TNCV_1210451 [Trichonephila clavipes]|nr:uncharacterized protein TNCV_1210451 [Trichonephila clavipes]
MFDLGQRWRTLDVGDLDKAFAPNELEENCTIRKDLRNIMHYFPSKSSFGVGFLNKMTVDLSWHWNILWSLVYLGGVATLNDLKNSITLHVRRLTTHQLRSAVEHTVYQIEILQMNEGGHVEHLSLHGPGHD